MARLDPQQQLRRCGVRVLDRLGLVKEQERPRARRQQRVIAGDQRIGRQHKIAVRDRAEPICAVVTVQRQDAQAWREPLRLPAPVRHQAGRRDHEGWIVEPTLRFVVGQQGESLDRLAESHVVRKHSAEADLTQKGEP